MTKAERYRRYDLKDFLEAIREGDWDGVRMIATHSIKLQTRKPTWCERMDRVRTTADWAAKWTAEHPDNEAVMYAVKVEMMAAVIEAAMEI